MTENYLRIKLTNVRGITNDTLIAEAASDREWSVVFNWDNKTNKFIDPATGGVIVDIDGVFHLELLFNDEPRRDPTFTFFA